MTRKRSPRYRKRMAASGFQPGSSFMAQQSGTTPTETKQIRIRTQERKPLSGFELSKKASNDLLLLAIVDTKFLQKSRDLIDMDVWPGENYRALLKCALDYYDEHQRAPGDYFNEYFNLEVEHKRFEGLNVKILRKHILQISKQKTPDRDATWILLGQLVDKHKIQEAGVAAVRLAGRGQLDKARELFVEALEQTDPSPLDETELARQVVFPVEIIAGAAGKFASLYSERLESPIQFFYMSFLTCLGSYLADRLRLQSELQTQPRLYTVLLGESAITRKSTAAKKTIELFEDALHDDDFNIIYGSGSGEGIAREIGDGKNPLLIFYDEFKNMVDKATAQSTSLLSLVNILFENNKWDNPIKDKQKSISVVDGYLSILAASTIKTFERLFTDQFLHMGFVNRLFLVPGEGERKDAIPTRISERERRGLRRSLRQITSNVGVHKILQIEPEAYALLNQWYHGGLGNEEMWQSVHSARLETYAIKLVALLAVNEGLDSVSEDVVAKVTKLMNWQFRVRCIHDPLDADNKIAKIEGLIRRALRELPDGKAIPGGKLKSKVGTHHYGIYMWNNAIQNLVREGEVAEKRRGRYKYYTPTKHMLREEK